MLETLLITFREGLEAFLIVAIMLAYVNKMGYTRLKKPIFSGIIVAIIISSTTGWHVAELAQDPVWEGSFAMIAGLMVASFTLYVMRTARHIKGDIGQKLEANAGKGGALAEIGVFIFTILMMSREGMETALMLGALTAQNDSTEMIIGALAGLASIAAIATLWASQSRRINIGLFLQVTGIFLVLFSIELFAYGLHELSEMAAIPFIGDNANMAFHTWSEPIEETILSNVITFGLIGIPSIWLLGSYLKDKFSKQNSLSAA